MKFDAAKFKADIIRQRCIVKVESMDVASKEIGISKSTLSRLERDKIPDIDTFVKVVKWLNTPVERYFIYESKSKIESYLMVHGVRVEIK